MSSELSSRISADLSLRERFDEQNYLQGERITNELSTELSSRVSADLSLRERFDEQNYLQGERITNELSTELSSRVDGDQSLQNQIDFITNNTDAAAIDSLTEIVSAFQSADGDINGAITALASTATSGLSTEVAARESADVSLFNALFIEIENEVDNRSDAQYSIDNAISTEISERGVAIDNEASIRLAADASIASGLSSEIEALADVDGTTIVLNGDTNQIELKESIAAPTSGIRTFAGEVDVETILKVGGVDVMATISSEISRAESAEDSLEIALSSEVSYLLANTDLSSIDSFAEVSDTLTAEVSTRQSIDEAIKAGVNAALTETWSILSNLSQDLQFRIMGDFTGDGTTTDFTSVLKSNSGQVFLNGLLQSEGHDYTVTNVTNGKGLNESTFSFLTAPNNDANVVIYGLTAEWINTYTSIGNSFTPLV